MGHAPADHDYLYWSCVACFRPDPLVTRQQDSTAGWWVAHPLCRSSAVPEFCAGTEKTATAWVTPSPASTALVAMQARVLIQHIRTLHLRVMLLCLTSRDYLRESIPIGGDRQRMRCLLPVAW